MKKLGLDSNYTGVKGYVECTATVTNYFPINSKGQADICCYQCKYFSRTTGTCHLTKEYTPYPQHYVGGNCPFEIITDNSQQ